MIKVYTHFMVNKPQNLYHLILNTLYLTTFEQAMSSYLWLSLATPGWHWLSLAILSYPRPYPAISVYLSGYFWTSLANSGYLQLSSLSSIKYQDAHRSRKEQVLAISLFRQHAASIYGFVRSLRYVCYVCLLQKFLQHFLAWQEAEIWYVDCSHK